MKPVMKTRIRLSMTISGILCFTLSFASPVQADPKENSTASSAIVGAVRQTALTTADPSLDSLEPVGVDQNDARLPDPGMPRDPSSLPYTNSTVDGGTYDSNLAGGSPTSVIPPDGRTRVTPTTGFPDRAIVYITRNGEHHCSGWMISPDTLVTAGHCLYGRDETGKRTWTTGLSFSPGADGARRPYGTATAVQRWTDVKYVRSSDPRYDWGVVKLNQKLGQKTGWFGLRWQSRSYNNSTATVRGYPGDKPAGQLWTMTGSITQSKPRNLCYMMDTYGGQSGSPVYPAGNMVIAIHTQGTGNSTCSGQNAGTRITKDLYTLILDLAW